MGKASARPKAKSKMQFATFSPTPRIRSSCSRASSVGSVATRFQGNLARCDLPGGHIKMPGTKAQSAAPQLGLRRKRQARGIGKRVKAFANLVAEHRAQFVVDLLDLHNLLQ